MQTKLTLQMDDELIARAKAHAKKRGKSVSQLVADYFRILEKVEQKPPSKKNIARLQSP